MHLSTLEKLDVHLGLSFPTGETVDLGRGGVHCAGLGEGQCSQSIASTDPFNVALLVYGPGGASASLPGSGIFTVVSVDSCLLLIL